MSHVSFSQTGSEPPLLESTTRSTSERHGPVLRWYYVAPVVLQCTEEMSRDGILRQGVTLWSLVLIVC